jgi:hypothetical protein
MPTDWTIVVRSPAKAKKFSSSFCVQTSSEAHLASCTMGTGGPLPGNKFRPGRETDHSLPSSAEVKNEQELYLHSPLSSAWLSGTALLFSFRLLTQANNLAVPCFKKTAKFFSVMSPHHLQPIEKPWQIPSIFKNYYKNVKKLHLIWENSTDKSLISVLLKIKLSNMMWSFHGDWS